jgi:Rad3-related DNA helicase
VQVKWENAVIVFDEAHNVESVCSDASSFDITSKNIADAMQEVKRSESTLSADLVQTCNFICLLAGMQSITDSII